MIFTVLKAYDIKVIKKYINNKNNNKNKND